MGAEPNAGPQPPKGAPEYQAAPRPADGANLALTIQKLEKGFDPDRPLLIWAIGSSFTNGLSNGDLLGRLIRDRFPNAKQFGYVPSTRERRVKVEASDAVRFMPRSWSAAEGGSVRTTAAEGSAVELRFTGNRVDMIGWRGPDGGTADVWIDGRPATEAEVFYATYIQPDKRNALHPPNPPRDRCPHAVSLGQNLVPQQWTINMTSDTGDYELVGSQTGPDGQGNAFEPFVSRSGQIQVAPEFWRGAKNNRTGDRFSFDVVRSALGTVEFEAPSKEKARFRLVTFLPNQQHTLRLAARGNGAVTIDAFDLFEPPLK